MATWFSDWFDFGITPKNGYTPYINLPATKQTTWTYTVPAKKSVTYHPASYSKRWKK
jgi:hypothetical protein